MHSTCRHCRALGSTKHPCKKCGSDTTMLHPHCNEPHYTPNDAFPERHTYLNCAHAHTHAHVADHDHDESGAVIGDSSAPRSNLPPWRERVAYFATAPWIRLLSPKSRQQCQYEKPLNLRGDTRRCKNRAILHYRPLKRSWSKKGSYCSNHIPWMYDMFEEERIERWLKKNPPPWKKEGSND